MFNLIILALYTTSCMATLHPYDDTDFEKRITGFISIARINNDQRCIEAFSILKTTRSTEESNVHTGALDVCMEKYGWEKKPTSPPPAKPTKPPTKPSDFDKTAAMAFLKRMTAMTDIAQKNNDHTCAKVFLIMARTGYNKKPEVSKNTLDSCMKKYGLDKTPSSPQPTQPTKPPSKPSDVDKTAAMEFEKRIAAFLAITERNKDSTCHKVFLILKNAGLTKKPKVPANLLDLCKKKYKFDKMSTSPPTKKTKPPAKPSGNLRKKNPFSVFSKFITSKDIRSFGKNTIPTIMDSLSR